MKRDIFRKLVTWRESLYRKPLILRGARQTGKTYILNEFGRTQYQKSHYFNFERDPKLASLFADNLDPDRLIRDLSLYGKNMIQAEKDLLIFDEIQECNAALNALKYFAEQAPQYHIAAAGSLLGVKMSQPRSFPVGKVDFLDLCPMTFYEFLDAIGESSYRNYLEQMEHLAPLPEAFHAELIELLRRFYFTGGMPEVVKRYAENPNSDESRTVQLSILDAYTLDFAKHAPSADIPKLSLIWESLPSQLTRENSKFLFSLIKEGARAREYENALTWLQGAGLVYRCTLVEAAKMPLAGHMISSSFKIYACDIGLLGALAGLPADTMRSDLSILTEFHGAFVENYVAQHLVALYGSSAYYWRNRGQAAEVDFLIQEGSRIIPIEAKSGMNIRSKSLTVFLEKFRPNIAVRVSLKNLKMDGFYPEHPSVCATKLASHP